MLNVTFLIVESSLTVRNLLRKSITNFLGAKKVFEACDGEEALDVLKSNKVDFIVSAIEMEKLSGKELLAKVRANPKLALTPFLIITSYHDESITKLVVEEGASGFLVKPFQPKILCDKIRSLWTGAIKRQHERIYNVPEHTMTIKCDGMAFRAELVNISYGGAQIKTEYNPNMHLLQFYEINIEFCDKKQSNELKLFDLFGMATRIELEDARKLTSKVCDIGLWFGAKRSSDEAESTLKKMIDWLIESSPEIIE